MVARGGSKGVPGKNLRKIGDLSLIGWKAQAARAADPNARLMISTDSPEIAQEARNHGIEVPFLRPAELATDTATTGLVIAHALSEISGDFERIMLLEPSAPFATGDHFNQAMELFDKRRADLVVGMKRTEPHTTFICEQSESGDLRQILEQMAGRQLRRQDLKDQWSMAGCLYLFRTSMFRETGNIYGGMFNFGVLIPKWNAIEIDHMDDLELAEYAYAKGYVNAAPVTDT